MTRATTTIETIESSELPGFVHHHVDIGGVTVHAVVGGQGPAVALLHGWPFTWTEWSRVMPRLAQAGYTVIAPDLRGTGQSAITEDGYDKATLAEDLRLLLHHLGYESVSLVGTDIGMMVAFTYALRWPDEVHRLVLGEGLLPGFGLEEKMNPATGGYSHFALHMQVDLAEMLTRGKEPEYLGLMLTMLAPLASDEERAQLIRQYARPGRMRAGFQLYGTLLADGRANRELFSEALSMPVLVLNGDQGIPHDVTYESVLRVAPDAEGDVIPDSGHTIGRDNPAWVSNRLTEFFGRTRITPAGGSPGPDNRLAVEGS